MQKHSRRQFFARMGAYGLALPALINMRTPVHASTPTLPSVLKDTPSISFYGKHQAGIITPQQRHTYLMVANLHTIDKKIARQMFKDWTIMAAKLTQGQAVGDSQSAFLPPADTGETKNLSAHHLTLTFGVSKSFLQKLGMHDKIHADFMDLPHFARDQLQQGLTGGDICIYACADDLQVAFHAIRQLVRHARTHITMHYAKAGFLGYDDINHTPRNLFGFKDGTASIKALQNPEQYIWVDAPKWLQNGTYLVLRHVQMHLETWDRTSLSAQEDTFGRHRNSGAPIGATNEFDHFYENTKGAHANIAHDTGTQILRRSYSYVNGVHPKTGQFDAGLLFFSFQKSPVQFIKIQQALGNIDKMSEYTTHIGSGLFACFGGVLQGEFLGQELFDS